MHKHTEEILQAIRAANSQLMELSTQKVQTIVDDISDRSGLSGQWSCIDDDIKKEITAQWEKIIGHEPHLEDARNIFMPELWGELIENWRPGSFKDQPQIVLDWMYENMQRT